jgi:nitroimidazol reductase NimA-like FMN-containing flavoprotein (pyridoxamine 5'-phosphate oxidase superfamily)
MDVGTGMNTPTTHLDQRYSGAGAHATSWEETQAALESAELFWLTTVRADGRPHVTPVVAVWADGALHFSTAAEEQKFLNLRANPNVVLTTGCNTWDRGLDVVVEGEAAEVTSEDVLRRLAAAWTGKWNGAWQFEVRDGGFRHPHGTIAVVVFRVAPAKAYAHSKGEPFGATTHKF